MLGSSIYSPYCVVDNEVLAGSVRGFSNSRKYGRDFRGSGIDCLAGICGIPDSRGAEGGSCFNGPGSYRSGGAADLDEYFSCGVARTTVYWIVHYPWAIDEWHELETSLPSEFVKFINDELARIDRTDRQGK